MYRLLTHDTVEVLTESMNDYAEQGYRVIWIEKSTRTPYVFVLMTNDQAHASLTSGGLF